MKARAGEGKGLNTCVSKSYKALKVISISILLTLRMKNRQYGDEFKE
jgi:hypothetical protein